MSVSFNADPSGRLAADTTTIPEPRESTKTAWSDLAGSNTASGTFKPDISQLSPFAELHALHQLLQTDPTRHQQVTQQIATNLASGIQALQGSGDTASANRLSELAADFGLASRLGGLPSVEGSNQAVAGTRGNLTSQWASADSEGDSSSGENLSDSKSNVNSLSTQYQPSVAEDGTQRDSQALLGIILSALSGAGIKIPNP